MPFIFEKLSISGLVLVTPKTFHDGRGFFFETYKYSEFAKNGITARFVQDNCSVSSKGVLRGLHYQIEPFAQAKLVQCLSGEIFDVAVDIREDSATFGKWFGVRLSGENHRMLFVPEGFAHGFVVLSDTAMIHYKCSAEYSPPHERGIIWNSATLKIEWPIEKPQLSERDLKFNDLADRK